MSTIIANTNLPHGCYVVGRAVGNFTHRSGVSKNGKPYQMLSGQILANQTFVAVTQRLEQGETIPTIPINGDDVMVELAGDFRKGGVLEVSGKISRRPAANLAEKGGK